MSTTGRRTTRSSGYVTRIGRCRATAHTTIQLDNKPRDGIEAPAASQTKDGVWQYVFMASTCHDYHTDITVSTQVQEAWFNQYVCSCDLSSVSC